MTRSNQLKTISIITPCYNEESNVREVYERVLGRDPKPQEAAKVKIFVAQYSATWQQAHPDAPASGVAHVAPAAYASDITAGVVRFDGLTQDDEVLDVAAAKEDSSLTVVPGSAQQAAWGAFVQALYGSAEFQFVR